MTIGAEEIMAFVDGELDQPAAARIAAAAETDPDLAGKIAAERRLREKLGAHFASSATEPIPSAWAALIATATNETAAPISLADARSARDERLRISSWRSPWIGAALAASLVLGMFIGPRWQKPADITQQDGALLAAGALADALDTQLAAAQSGRPIQILGSFRRVSGDYCRVFTGDAAAGIACRGGNGWHLQEVVPGTHAEAGAYRQAASTEAELMGQAQNMAAGAPLDAAQEAVAKARGWRT